MDKTMSPEEAVGQLRSGMTIGFGGWGARRKPMALVRAIIRAGLKDLTIAAYGGPEIGMLCAAGCVRKVIFGFVTLDTVPLEPYFRKAREGRQVEVMELDEGMFQLGLRAAAMQVPFLPTRAGLGTAVMDINPDLKTVVSPYADAELLVAMPALPLDAALIHVHRADRLGNTRIDSADPYFDEQIVRAAAFTLISSEQVVDRLEDRNLADVRTSYFERSFVRAVVEAPGGAHPTSCAPLYGWDAKALQDYVASAKADGGFEAYRERLGGDEGDYMRQTGGLAHVRSLAVDAL